MALSCGSGGGSRSTPSSSDSLPAHADTRSLFTHIWTAVCSPPPPPGSAGSSGGTGMHAKLPCLQKGHWHLIFGAGLNAGRRLDRGEERDHVEVSSHQQQPWSTRRRRGAASSPAQLLPGHGQAVVAMPGDPRKDVEVNQCREKGSTHPSSRGSGSCAAPCKGPLQAAAPRLTRTQGTYGREAGSCSGQAGGGWTCRTVEGLKVKIKEREISPLAAFLGRKTEDLIETGACAERGGRAARCQSGSRCG